MSITLHPFGLDRELWVAKADDNSWSFPLYVDWRVDKHSDVHYARIVPALCPCYEEQTIMIFMLQAMLKPHDILGRPDEWVIPRKTAEDILVKATGITPKCYYRAPKDWLLFRNGSCSS